MKVKQSHSKFVNFYCFTRTCLRGGQDTGLFFLYTRLFRSHLQNTTSFWPAWHFEEVMRIWEIQTFLWYQISKFRSVFCTKKILGKCKLNLPDFKFWTKMIIHWPSNMLLRLLNKGEMSYGPMDGEGAESWLIIWGHVLLGCWTGEN